MKTIYCPQLCKKRFALITMYMFILSLSFAQETTSVEGISLGKIPVYIFRLDSLNYKGIGKRLSAIGTEISGDLYITRIDNTSYFNIIIDGQSYAVISNPYNRKVSSREYYKQWLYKDGEYVSTPDLTHMAGGSYFLQLPYAAKNNESNSSNTNSVTSTNSISDTNKSEKHLDWQVMGRVQAVSDIHTRRSGGEDDVVYEKETAFLLSAFDGEKLKYKLSVPRNGAQYDVYTNGSYNGARIKWDTHGKHVWSIPSLSQMYTHRAGGYYFNVGDVKP